MFWLPAFFLFLLVYIIHIMRHQIEASHYRITGPNSTPLPGSTAGAGAFGILKY